MFGIYSYSGTPSLDMASLSYDNAALNVFWAASFVLLLIYGFKLLGSRDLVCRFFDSWGCSTMLLFILHPYTNNIAHLVVEKLHFGGWSLKLAISMIILQFVLMIKQRFSNRWIFKYV